MTSEVIPTKMIRVLVAEDEAIVARDICLQLTELGYDPVADTPLAEEAIELVEQHRPDLVLMDINLAGKMDGIAAARIIRDRFAVPVVFITAFSGNEILARAKEAGPYGYLIKPFAEQDLRTTIEMAIYKHHSEEQLRESEARLQAITDSAQNAIVMMDPQGLITFWNPAGEKILGYRSDEVLGKELHQLLTPARFRAAHYAAHPKFLLTGEGHHQGRMACRGHPPRHYRAEGHRGEDAPAKHGLGGHRQFGGDHGYPGHHPVGESGLLPGDRLHL